MADTCTLTAGCTFPTHQPSDHPCGKKHTPGTPCDNCGKPTPANGDPCWDCWTPITIADAKAIFAEDGLSVDFTERAGDARG